MAKSIFWKIFDICVAIIMFAIAISLAFFKF
jgi:arginine exporter protein ArgO